MSNLNNRILLPSLDTPIITQSSVIKHTLSSILQGEYTLDQVRALIEAGADVNEEFTLSRDEVIKLAKLSHDVDESIAEEGLTRNVTPLIYGVANKDLGLVELLLNKGADVNKSTNTEGYNAFPIYEAVCSNNLGALELLLNNKVQVNIRDESNCTPLHYATSAEAVKLLLEGGADIHAADDMGFTALHNVQNLEVARALVENGSNIDVMSSNNSTPLSHFIVTGQIELVEWLLDQKIARDPHYKPGFDVAGVLGICYFNELDEQAKAEKLTTLFDIFVSRGVDFNHTRDDRLPLIHNAIISDNTTLLKILVNNDSVDKNLKAEGWPITPLEYAISHNKLTCAEILLQGGADTQAKDRNNQTLLEKYIHMGDVRIVKLLVDCGVSINAIIDRQTGQIQEGKIGSSVEESVKKEISDIIESITLTKLDAGASIGLHHIHRAGNQEASRALLPEIAEHIRSFLNLGAKADLVRAVFSALPVNGANDAQDSSTVEEMPLINNSTTEDDIIEEPCIDEFRDGYMSFNLDIAANPNEHQVDISGAISRDVSYNDSEL